MTYDPNIPAPNNFLSADQPRMQTNFSRTNASFGVDHVDIVTPANSSSGEHKQTTFSNVQADPALIYPKGRIYQKNFGKPVAQPAPGYNHEIYYAATRENSPQLINLVPTIKCMCRFAIAGAGGTLQQVLPGTAVTPDDSLIINMNAGNAGLPGSPGTVLMSANTRDFTVTFLNNLNYSSYFVFVTQEGPISPNFPDYFISTKTLSSFIIHRSAAASAGQIIGFMVI